MKNLNVSKNQYIAYHTMSICSKSRNIFLKSEFEHVYQYTERTMKKRTIIKSSLRHGSYRICDVMTPKTLCHCTQFEFIFFSGDQWPAHLKYKKELNSKTGEQKSITFSAPHFFSLSNQAEAQTKNRLIYW